MMNEDKSTVPAGWDAERVKRLIDHYEGLSEDEKVPRMRRPRTSKRGRR